MPTRKVSDDKWPDEEVCQHPDHNPPAMRVFEPGTYEHQCSGCKRKFTFTVGAVRLSTRQVKVKRG